MSNKWVFDKAIKYYGDTNSYGLHKVASYDYVLYTDFDVSIKNYGGSSTEMEKDTVNGITVPSWYEIDWFDFKDLSKSLTSEIVGILPIVLSVMLLYLSIRRGIAFILDILRSA